MKKNSTLIWPIIMCIVISVILFLLGLEAVRNPSMLGENPPKAIIDGARTFFIIVSGVLIGGILLRIVRSDKYDYWFLACLLAMPR